MTLEAVASILCEYLRFGDACRLAAVDTSIRTRLDDDRPVWAYFANRFFVTPSMVTAVTTRRDLLELLHLRCVVCERRARYFFQHHDRLYCPLCHRDTYDREEVDDDLEARQLTSWMRYE